MHNIYFTRHGETVWNVENKICGATDIALTETVKFYASYTTNILNLVLQYIISQLGKALIGNIASQSEVNNRRRVGVNLLYQRLIDRGRQILFGFGYLIAHFLGL